MEGLSVLMSRLFTDRTTKLVNPAKPVRGGGSPSAVSGISAEYDLSKLTRLQLLELLEDAVAENERLKQELTEAKDQLADKRIAIDDSESLAEASLRLAGVFTAAQHAIDLYGWNVSMQRAGNVSSHEEEHEPEVPDGKTESELSEDKEEGAVDEASKTSETDASSTVKDCAASKKEANTA